jgi:hypothetical protein
MFRYKNDLLPDQKDRIKKLATKQFHHQISTEIVRELANSVIRGELPQLVPSEVASTTSAPSESKSLGMELS